MQRPEFHVTIGKDGKVHAEVRGSQGSECLALADLIRDIIGHEESRALTSEYYGPGAHVLINTKVQNRVRE